MNKFEFQFEPRPVSNSGIFRLRHNGENEATCEDGCLACKLGATKGNVTQKFGRVTGARPTSAHCTCPLTKPPPQCQQTTNRAVGSSPSLIQAYLRMFNRIADPNMLYSCFLQGAAEVLGCPLSGGRPVFTGLCFAG